METKKLTIQQALINIQSSLKAPKGQTNDYGHYRYRSAEDILEAVKKLLHDNECSLVITDDIAMVGTRIYVKATANLMCNGEQISATAFARESDAKKGMDESQITGAASSYARKYALNGLFCIDDTKDADALNVNKEYTQKVKNSPSKDDINIQDVLANIKLASSRDELARIWSECSAFQTNKDFVAALSARKNELNITK